MIEKIDISDASIAEEVRKQMSVATSENKGLMRKEDSTKVFRVNSLNEVNTSINKGLIIISADGTGSMGICASSIGVIDMLDILSGVTIGINIQSGFYVCVYKKEATGPIYIKTASDKCINIYIKVVLP